MSGIIFIIIFSLNFIGKGHTSLCKVEAIVQLTNPVENSMQALCQPQCQAPSSGKTNKQSRTTAVTHMYTY